MQTKLYSLKLLGFLFVLTVYYNACPYQINFSRDKHCGNELGKRQIIYEYDRPKDHNYINLVRNANC